MHRDAFWFAGSPSAISAAGFVAVAADLAAVRFVQPLFFQYAVRGASAATILLFMILSRRAMPSDYGMSATGWRGDAAWIFKLGLIVLGVYAAFVAFGILAVRSGWFGLSPAEVERYRDFRDLDGFRTYALSALVCAPVVEELVYRGFAVTALAAGFGRRGAFWLSGPVFYLLHLAYGRHPALVHYFIAGWILAWAFLRCGRIWVPIVLHSLGNVLMGLDDALLLFAPDFARGLLGG